MMFKPAALAAAVVGLAPEEEAELPKVKPWKKARQVGSTESGLSSHWV
jgi:hypothetical protein